MEGVIATTVAKGPEPWAVTVQIKWDFRQNLSHRARWQKLKPILEEVVDTKDYNIRYDNVLDVTHVHFRNPEQAAWFAMII